MKKMHAEISIIGAGIGGISLGHFLRHNQPLILEKSKGIGGRVATRRIAGIPVNHGVQSFSIKEALLEKLLEDSKELFEKKDGSLLPIGGITDWIKKISQGLLIEREIQIKGWKQVGDHYELIDENNIAQVTTHKIVLATPAPQAMALIESSGMEAEFLAQVQYSSEIQFFAITSCDIPIGAADRRLELISSTQVTSETKLHRFVVKNEFLSSLIIMDKNELTFQFELALKKAGINVLETHLHKWKFSEAINYLPEHYQLTFKDRNIYLMGDYFYPEGINGVIRSMKTILNCLKSN